MVHLFSATRIGWNQEKDMVWFKTDQYSKEEAKKQFVAFSARTNEGWPYTGYEYDGVKYHDFHYIGEFDENNLPKTENEARMRLLAGMMNRMKETRND